jgi:hypothetical protein
MVPLLIEGIVQGAVGGLLASCMILGSHELMARLLTNLAGFIRLGPLPSGMVFTIIVSMGAAYGLVCSLFAVRDPRGID